MSEESASTPQPRPLAGARFLLPVWGSRYIDQFMNISLPTWLAPGNMPAVAAAVDTEFVFLTSADDEAFIRAHPSFLLLTSCMKVRFHPIDHLIIGSNYSTTITLAYEEALRAEGKDGSALCFFFLVSDFIVADGSFRNAFQKIAEGYSGVLTGNFQVTEKALDWLHERLALSPRSLSLPARELVRWAMNHLHPVTMANTVNFASMHNAHSNRLFWRVDDETMIGRFFLMHMLCIRPETGDFSIGSSCDYSFIPELCPSDAVYIMADSDDYLVVEMQPDQHQIESLRLGPRRIEDLAETLSEWTTARHRKNTRTVLVFHGGELPANFPDVEAESEAYLQKVARLWSKKPQPHRNHPYWQGAIAHWREASGLPLSDFEWRFALGYSSALSLPDRYSEYVKDLGLRLLGRPPHTGIWHPRGPDYRLILTHLPPEKGKNDRKQIRISEHPTPFTATCAPRPHVMRMRKNVFLKRKPTHYSEWAGHFDHCLIEMLDFELADAQKVLNRVGQLMKPGAKILLSVTSRNTSTDIESGIIASLLGGLQWHKPDAVEIAAVPTGPLRKKVHACFVRLGQMVRDRPAIGIPLFAALGLPLFLLSWLINRAIVPVQSIDHQGALSSLLLVIDSDAVKERMEEPAAAE